MVKLVVLLLLTVVAPLTHASFISDVHYNNIEKKALNLDSSFSTGVQEGVIGSDSGWSWVSISGDLDNFVDFYSFTNPESGSNWWFDIDNAFGSMLTLYSTSGVEIWTNIGTGCTDLDASSVGCDSLWADDDSFFLEEIGVTLDAGDYILVMNSYFRSVPATSIPYGLNDKSYVLNVSTDATLSSSVTTLSVSSLTSTSVSQVPEPSSILILGLGLLAIRVVCSAKRKYVTA
ncbi:MULTISPECIES: PEP-CTERM sorting domain-containing protein [Vibrio]|uniref:PEP-CTERM sorting domain-containing protein n=2 Tax=Vibrio TaxID=662 RepID=A0A7X4LQ26_9VIBR|nr:MULTISPECIES: PEP-CTERM sorting domain-containing protein [Vibrio]MBF9003533.1 PEP-CTERM sorting domain-containing protein [Vibrio nitrifigilis]MZI96093.1 PEP-CTERM sorting domain-containing protein [Vibrio eleionomae]